MKRFILGKFTDGSVAGSAQNRAAAVLSALMHDADVTRSIYDEAIAKGPRGDNFDWDFIVEVWFSNEYHEPDFERVAAAANEAGIDAEKSRTVLISEKLMMEGSAPVKGTFLSRRKPGTTVDEYLKYWLGPHAEVIMAQKDFYSYVRRYVQNHFVADTFRNLKGKLVPQEESFDGSPQMWFESVDEIYSAFRTEGYTRHIRDDEMKFLKFGFSQSFIARECELAIVD